MPDKITYIEFPSADRDASGAFFEQAFGWGRISYGPAYEGLDQAGIDTGIDASSERVSAPLAIVQTDDLDAAQARVLAAGAVITRPQFDFPGGRRFHFREPGGCELAVFVERL